MRGMRLHAALFTALLAAPTLLAQDPAIRIHAATLLDGTGKTVRNATVVVQGSKITSVESAAAANATYNLGQLTIMPGMIDVHGISTATAATRHARARRRRRPSTAPRTPT
jgi:imidazolonepropionase-like amidohydrolase